MRTVTFCGHSKLVCPELIKKQLYVVTEKLIRDGAETFLLGGYGEFDFLSALTVKELKVNYPHIKSVFVTPYVNKKYDKNLYDCVEYPPIENVPPRYAIIHRNRCMVFKADAVVAYVAHDFGGAAKTLDYAKKQHKTIINLAEM